KRLRRALGRQRQRAIAGARAVAQLRRLQLAAQLVPDRLGLGAAGRAVDAQRRVEGLFLAAGAVVDAAVVAARRTASEVRQRLGNELALGGGGGRLKIGEPEQLLGERRRPGRLRRGLERFCVALWRRQVAGQGWRAIGELERRLNHLGLRGAQ